MELDSERSFYLYEKSIVRQQAEGEIGIRGYESVSLLYILDKTR